MRKWWLSRHTNAYRVHIPTLRMLIGRGGVVGGLVGGGCRRGSRISARVFVEVGRVGLGYWYAGNG
jgi:hypothetical protein